MVNWDSEKITDEATKFAACYGYPLPTKVVLSGRMVKNWGTANPVTRVITLNRRFVELNEADVVLALIRHEVGHLKYPDHGDGFKGTMGKHGYGVHLLESDGVSVTVERVVYKCGNCEKEYLSKKELKGKYRCGVCKSEKIKEGGKVIRKVAAI